MPFPPSCVNACVGFWTRGFHTFHYSSNSDVGIPHGHRGRMGKNFQMWLLFLRTLRTRIFGISPVFFHHPGNLYRSWHSLPMCQTLWSIFINFGKSLLAVLVRQLINYKKRNNAFILQISREEYMINAQNLNLYEKVKNMSETTQSQNNTVSKDLIDWHR